MFTSQVLLDEEERKSDNDDWYLPKIQNFETFLKEVATWKIVQKDLQAKISPSAFGQHFQCVTQ